MPKTNKTKQTNLHLSKFTHAQIKALEESTGMTKTQIMTVAIDNFFRNQSQSSFVLEPADPQ